MATRTIVTSQPDVECEVCARRLLRGEQPDVFLAAGRRRIVCELCAPRAAHEGWLRETDGQSLSLPPMRPRRGRSLFERLRQVARPVGDARDDATPSTWSAPVPALTRPVDVVFDASPQDVATDVVSEAVVFDGPRRSGRVEELEHEEPSAYVEHCDEHSQAIAVFNASEFPRRVAGVTRSLGPPSVSVRSAEHLSSVVLIVVAWELCWYRYEVDLSEPVVEARAIAQGTELAELAREDRLANAAAEESGTLVLVGL